MSFFIRKPSPTGDVWLRRAAGGAIWGVKERALSFASRDDAARTLMLLPPKERSVAVIEDGRKTAD